MHEDVHYVCESCGRESDPWLHVLCAVIHLFGKKTEELEQQWMSRQFHAPSNRRFISLSYLEDPANLQGLVYSLRSHIKGKVVGGGLKALLQVVLSWDGRRLIAVGGKGHRTEPTVKSIYIVFEHSWVEITLICVYKTLMLSNTAKCYGG